MFILMKLKDMLKKSIPSLVKIFRSLNEVTDSYNSRLYFAYKKRQINHPNPLCKYGAKFFSQADEDGLTLEIIKRLDISKGTFVELGVGPGVENNTLILLASGWSGYWIGGEDLLFDIPPNSRLSFHKSWITKENVTKLLKNDVLYQEPNSVDLLSIDLDGNDIYFLDKILTEGTKPKIIISEYNSKFPPPIRFSIAYDKNHLWERDDYQGSSLQNLVDLLCSFGYKLICCNAATGVNAFFVHEDYSHLFPEVPKSIDEIYADPFHLFFSGITWPTSLKTIKKIISNDKDLFL